MSHYFLSAIHKINRRNPSLCLTKKCLFNLLLDYNAFNGNPALKFIVKTLIEEGYWDKLAKAWNEGSYEQVKMIEHNIKNDLGFREEAISMISNAIRNAEDWDENLNPAPFKSIIFEGLPLTGTTDSFRDGLLQQGYGLSDDGYNLIGTFRGIADCIISPVQSNAECPLYKVTISFPKDTEVRNILPVRDEYINQIKSILSNSPYPYVEDCAPRYVSMQVNERDGKLILTITDPFGHDVMVESFIPKSNNNLQTMG